MKLIKRKFGGARYDGFVLRSRGRGTVWYTLDKDQDEAWAKSFKYLYARKEWMRPHWKQWDESIAAAEKRGWRVEPISLVEVDQS